MKPLSVLLYLALFSSIAATAQIQGSVSGKFKIPSGGIPLAQIFDSKIEDADVYTKNASKVYFIWGAKKADADEQILDSKYFPSIRNPDRKLDIAWYQKNHPDWIMYQQDQKTPAYGYIYNYGGLVPLNVSDKMVQEYYLNSFIKPALKLGYSAVAMDNVDFSNWPKAVGHFKDGQWQNSYTGKKNDTVFHRTMLNWLKFLSSNLQPQGIKVVANIKANTAPEKTIVEAIRSVDIWLDETGFAHRGINVTDKEWDKTVSILQKITPDKGYVSINQMNGEVETAPAGQVEWVIANFLLTRGPQSLLAMVSYTDKAIYHTFNYRKEFDTNIGEPAGAAEKGENGIWSRKYTKGIVYVNPSSKETVTISLPTKGVKGIDGKILKGSLTLAPATAKLLTF